MINPIPYGRQFISDEDIKAVVDTLKSDYLTQGPKIKEFEDAFAEYIGVRFAVAVSNGTAALHLCTLALDLKEGEKVLTTPITFAASANCIRYVNGDVEFIDIDPETYLIDINKLKKKLSGSKPGSYKGIIPVDFTGRSVNMEELHNLALSYNLWIIDDACHAPGGSLVDSKGIVQYCGNCNYADLAIFSFHPVKHIACGEGGMITTNNEILYEKLLRLRTHGITRNPDLLIENHGPWYYEMQELGYNYRLTDFQASLGLSQLKRAEAGIKKRREIASRYYDAFKNKDFIIGQSGVIEGHAYHLYIIEVNNRNELFIYLRNIGIFSQVHYIPVHLMPYYKKLGWKEGDMPEAEKYYSRCISLPMFPTLTDEEQNYVINSIFTFYMK